MKRFLSFAFTVVFAGAGCSAPATTAQPRRPMPSEIHDTGGGVAGSADTVRYSIRFPNAAAHEAEIEVRFDGVPARPLEVRMSRTSPGRYALHEFAKNVYSVSASDGAGRELEIHRPNPHQWDIPEHDGTVVFRYTLFGDRTDGTYTAIDRTHAHLNMPATFVWAREMEDRPISITFAPHDPSFRIATQLRSTTDPNRFTARDLQYFLDSPTEISDHLVRSWTVETDGRVDTIRIALHHLGSDADADRFAEMTRRVVDAQIAVFGEAPRFDYGSYVFIADYLPWAAGDGMEHRNSTILTSSRPLDTGAMANLGTVSHEFFHAWNVERLRPRSLEPFDFEEANMSADLWFAEGFTSYYTPLLIARAGLMDVDGYAASLGGTLNAVINAPGRRYFSPREMSMQAPFVDAAVSVDPTNRANTFLSYYTWGAAIGAGLDLTLRQRFGVTLDDYMRALWRSHGDPERPYEHDDLRDALGRLTGDAAFARDFFARYIEGSEVPDYAALLAPAGLELRAANPGEAWIGASRFQFADGTMQVMGPVHVGSPLYDAGVQIGDTIVRVGGAAPPTSQDALSALLARHRPGDRLELAIRSRGEELETALVLRENPALRVVTYESAGRPVSDEIRAFREAWLGALSSAPRPRRQSGAALP